MPLIVRMPRNERVLRRHGRYRRALNVLDPQASVAQRRLKRRGLNDDGAPTQATLLALVETASRPTVFLDVGAHIGLYSALVAAVYSDLGAEVHAIEPTPATAEIARQIATANRLPVVVEQVAMSSSPGTAQLIISARAETSNSLVAGFRESAGVVDVAVTTIDAYCRDKQIAPSVIKIDVEMLESEVLAGGLQTFEKCRPSIVCELLPEQGESGQLHDVLTRLDDIGYVLHHWDETAWVPTALAEYRDHLAGGHRRRDWLMTPGPLPRSMPAAVRRWRDAIATCTRAKNVLVADDDTLPGNWDATFVVKAPRWRRALRRIRSTITSG